MTGFKPICRSLTVYWWNLNSLTFPYPPERKKAEYVAGTKPTPDAQKYKDENPGKTISSIVADYDGMENRELVWSPDARFAMRA